MTMIWGYYWLLYDCECWTILTCIWLWMLDSIDLHMTVTVRQYWLLYDCEMFDRLISTRLWIWDNIDLYMTANIGQHWFLYNYDMLGNIDLYMTMNFGHYWLPYECECRTILTCLWLSMLDNIDFYITECWTIVTCLWLSMLDEIDLYLAVTVGQYWLLHDCKYGTILTCLWLWMLDNIDTGKVWKYRTDEYQNYVLYEDGEVLRRFGTTKKFFKKSLWWYPSWI